MTPNTVAPAPTEAELDVLRVLWARGASTVREVHDAIAKAKPVGYTTVLKQMQVMHRKGLVSRSERFRSHVYEAAQPRARVQRDLAHSLLRQAFGGSAASLVQSALGGRKVSAAELAEIREVLAKFGGKP
jgi:predicted transcriptional regulator